MKTNHISFTVDDNEVVFTVRHNLDEFGLGIAAAAENWAARTDTATIESFCKYVKSKHPEIICDPA